MRARQATAGFTLIEVLIATALGALIVTSVSTLLPVFTATRSDIEERLELTRQADFALQQMARALGESRRLLVPQPDKSGTAFRENVREETVPASPPESGSLKATAVLAVSLSSRFDLDGDGFADADNDRDGLLDEDLPGDTTNDSEPGVSQVDDGGNGLVDEGFFADEDDDERLNVSNEDPVNGVDDDGDGDIDEDSNNDMNGDNAPGLAGIDDDGDGQVDEGNVDDDDEDGQADEDWIDAVVFSLQGSTLEWRQPVPWDETGSNGIDGRDWRVSTLAENVSLLRFERIAGGGRFELVDIRIALTGASGQVVQLETRVRAGGLL